MSTTTTYTGFYPNNGRYSTNYSVNGNDLAVTFPAVYYGTIAAITDTSINILCNAPPTNFMFHSYYMATSNATGTSDVGSTGNAYIFTTQFYLNWKFNISKTTYKLDVQNRSGGYSTNYNIYPSTFAFANGIFTITLGSSGPPTTGSIIGYSIVVFG